MAAVGPHRRFRDVRFSAAVGGSADSLCFIVSLVCPGGLVRSVFLWDAGSVRLLQLHLRQTCRYLREEWAIGRCGRLALFSMECSVQRITAGGRND
jgi:hypothetical protein